MKLKYPKTILEKIQDAANGIVCTYHYLPATFTMGSFTREVSVQTCCKEFGDQIKLICNQIRIDYNKSQHKRLKR